MRIVKIYRVIIFCAIVSFMGCVTPEKKQSASYAVKPDIAIKNINELPENYALELKKYVSTDKAYIIVHPSYYVYFHKKDFSITPSDSKNAVKTFVETEFSNGDSVLHLLKEYERAEMELIAQAWNKKQIVILIIPGRYLKSKQYIFRDSSDEYARYLNEIAGGSDSVFYLESRRANSGKISVYDRFVLLNFLKKLGVRKILIGGGYVGRCQEEFYKFFSESWNEKDLAIIPEISAFSPNDITDSTARMLMTADRRINPWAVKYFLKNGGLETLGKKLNVQSISTSR